jgi:hypothetical protein
MDEQLHDKLVRWRPRFNVLAKEVRQARIAAGIEQKLLAEAVGRPRLWLAKRENGWNRMRIPEHKMLLQAIARMKASQKPSP